MIHFIFLYLAIPETIIIKNKTSLHIKLENAITKNKKIILHLIQKDNPASDEIQFIHHLREDAKSFIRKLNFLIECERKFTTCNLNRTCKFINIVRFFQC